MKKEIEQKNLPYTVVGHTSVSILRFSILLTAEGIKELAKRMKKGDMVRITEWSDISQECEKNIHYQKITIIKKVKSLCQNEVGSITK